MAFVVLTRRNVAALKSSLIAAFPGLGSGHADESIAAGLGYRTYAALLASLKVQGTAKLVVVLSERDLGDRLHELAGVEPVGEAWVSVWRAPLPDQRDVYGFGEWWKDVANEN
jgi:hypothetical protein